MFLFCESCFHWKLGSSDSTCAFLTRVGKRVQVCQEVWHTTNIVYLCFSTLTRQLPCCVTTCWLLREFWSPILFTLRFTAREHSKSRWWKCLSPWNCREFIQNFHFCLCSILGPGSLRFFQQYQWFWPVYRELLVTSANLIDYTHFEWVVTFSDFLHLMVESCKGDPPFQVVRLGPNVWASFNSPKFQWYLCASQK